MAMNLDALLRIKANVLGENNIRRLGNSLQGLQGQAKNAALGFNNLKGAVAGFGAAIAGSAIVAGLGAIVKKSIDAGGELDDLRQKTGVSASALFAIGNAAKVADVDLGTLGKGLNKLNINLVKAAEGNEDLARKFQSLGVNVKDANGEIVPADKALKQIADRFADMPDGAKKAELAVALFGKAGADLIPLLNQGAKSLEQFKSKLTPKEFEEFTARSDEFGESLTGLSVKTGTFSLELTDALLPALQSILEVFSDLFDTKQDWTALFDVIKVGLRAVATVIYAMIKLVDQLIKAVVYSVDAIGKALKGDFEGAGRAIKQGFGAGLEQAKRDFAQIQKLWTDAPSPGTGQRSGGRGMALDTSAADTAAAAAAKKAATEQERAAQRYNDGLKGAIDLAGDLNKQIRDIKLTTESVGASPVQKILNELQASLNAIQDEQETLFKKADEFTNKTGIQFEGLRNKIKALGAAKVELANETYQQDFAELYASQGEAIDKATESVYENARALQYNNDIMGGLKDGLSGYIEQIGTMRDALSSLGQQAFKGIEDALVSLVTTGTANFREFAVSILQETSRMIIQQLVLKSIMQAIGAIGGGGGGFLAGGGGGFTQFNASGVDFNPVAFSGTKLFANGGIMTGDGPLPLNKYASGGIANSPQLAMFGEGSTPEAYVPLPDGRRIPVAMQGGGGGSTTVNVSVDAKGTSVQGNSGQGEQLGRVISQAMQAELIKQRRPGGILAMA
jgi:lambda family phage tail tape measure protein